MIPPPSSMPEKPVALIGRHRSVSAGNRVRAAGDLGCSERDELYEAFLFAFLETGCEPEDEDAVCAML